MIVLVDILLGQSVILVFLLFVTLRPLLKKTRNKDVYAVLSVISVFFSVLLIAVFGLSFLMIVIFFLSFVVMVTNATSLYRLFAKLYTGSYSTTFCVISYVQAACVLICIILCIVFQPAYINKAVYNHEVYTGSFSRGFSKKDRIAESTNLILTEYSIENATMYSYETPDAIYDNPAVVFISDVGTMAADSALRLTKIAESGVTVLTGDFYTDDAPITQTVMDYPINKRPVFKSFALHNVPENQLIASGFLEQKELELESLLYFAGQRYSSVVIIAEGDVRQVALNARRKYPNFIVEVFSTTGDRDVDTYYREALGDYLVLNPFDSLFTSFESLSEYNELKRDAKQFLPEENFANAVLERIKVLSKEN